MRVNKQEAYMLEEKKGAEGAEERSCGHSEREGKSVCMCGMGGRGHREKEGGRVDVATVGGGERGWAGGGGGGGGHREKE